MSIVSTALVRPRVKQVAFNIQRGENIFFLEHIFWPMKYWKNIFLFFPQVCSGKNILAWKALKENILFMRSTNETNLIAHDAPVTSLYSGGRGVRLVINSCIIVGSVQLFKLQVTLAEIENVVWN